MLKYVKAIYAKVKIIKILLAINVTSAIVILGALKNKVFFA